MKKIMFTVVLTLSFIPTKATEQKQAAAQQIVTAYPGIKKISDDLYVGKAADQFYLAMERVNHSSVYNWKEYAYLQKSSLSNELQYLPNTDGSSHFASVLAAYISGEIPSSNEVWVAYASRIPVIAKAKLDTSGALRNPDVEMFVTVVSSPEALITSHMGISRTVEAAEDLQRKLSTRKKHPDQSVYLHSFAAKVMKLRDPKKFYMLTAPAQVMRDILFKKMPNNTVFVGDSLYQEGIEAAQKDPGTLLLKESFEKDEDETQQEFEQRLAKEKEVMYRLDKIQDKILLLQTNPPRIVRVIDPQNRRKQTFTIQKPDKSNLVTFDQNSSIYQWMFSEPFANRGLRLPYVLVDLDALANAVKLVA